MQILNKNTKRQKWSAIKRTTTTENPIQAIGITLKNC